MIPCHRRCTKRQEKFHHFLVAIEQGAMQRCAPEVVARIDRAAACQKRPDCRVALMGGRQVQGDGPVFVRGQRQGGLRACPGKARVAPLRANFQDFGVHRQQIRRRCGLGTQGGVMQRGVSRVVGLTQTGSLFQQCRYVALLNSKWVNRHAG